jgi:hypothetical protein
MTWDNNKENIFTFCDLNKLPFYYFGGKQDGKYSVISDKATGWQLRSFSENIVNLPDANKVAKVAKVAMINITNKFFVLDADTEEANDLMIDFLKDNNIDYYSTPSHSNVYNGKSYKNHYWFKYDDDLIDNYEITKKVGVKPGLDRITGIIAEPKGNQFIKNIPTAPEILMNSFFKQKLEFKPIVEEVDKQLNDSNFGIEFHRELMTIADDKYKRDFEDWVKFTFMCKNENSLVSGDYFKLWRDYSNYDKYKKSNNERIKEWENFKLSDHKKVTFKTLSYELKLEKPQEFNAIIKKYIKVKVSEEKEEGIAYNEEEVAVIAYEKLKNNFMYINKQFYGKNSNIWSNDIVQFDSLLRNAIVDLKIIKRTEKQIKGGFENVDIIYCNTKNHLNAVFARVKDFIIVNARDDIYYKFHETTLGKICFEDGVYDFRKKQFYKWTSDYLIENPVYSCVKINRCFPSNQDDKDNEKINKVFVDSMGEEQATIFLKYLARVCAGEIQDKLLSSLIFNRDSSKGVINDWFENAFGNYVGQADSNQFIVRDMMESSEKENGWLIPFQYKRFMFVSEFSIDQKNTKRKIDAKLVKQINSGGDTIKGRYMRCDGIAFKIQCSTIFMGNDMIPPTSNDMYEKCLQLTSSTQFKTEEQIKQMLEDVKDIPQLYNSYKTNLKLADQNLRANVKSNEWADALIRIIIKYYDNKPIVITKAKFQDEDDESIEKIILSYFTITGKKSDVVSNDVLRTFAINNNVTLKKLKEAINSIDSRVIDFKDRKIRGMCGICTKNDDDNNDLDV